MLIIWSVSVNPFTQKHNRFYSAVVHLYQISGKVAHLSDFGILSVPVAFIHKDRFNIFVPYFERQISAGFLHRGL